MSGTSRPRNAALSLGALAALAAMAEADFQDTGTVCRERVGLIEVGEYRPPPTADGRHVAR